MKLPKLFCDSYQEYQKIHDQLYSILNQTDSLVKKVFDEKLENIKNFNELYDYYSSLLDGGIPAVNTPFKLYEFIFTQSEQACPLGQIAQPQPEFNDEGKQITQLEGYRDVRQKIIEAQPTSNINTEELKKELENINITLIGISIILALFLSYGILKKFLFKD